MTTATGSGTKADPWVLKTPPGTSEYQMYLDDAADPPAIICQVGGTQLQVRQAARSTICTRCSRRTATGCPSAAPTSRSPHRRARSRPGAAPRTTRVGGWYGLKKGLRGRFGVYMPPLMEALGLAEVTHDAKNNRMRAL